MNYQDRSGIPGAKTQSKQPFSKLCLPIWTIPTSWVPLCVAAGYVLHPLQMEERNSLLKYFQDTYWLDGHVMVPLDSLNLLRELSQRREIWSSPIIDVQVEGTNSSNYASVPEGHATVGPGGA